MKKKVIFAELSLQMLRIALIKGNNLINVINIALKIEK